MAQCYNMHPAEKAVIKTGRRTRNPGFGTRESFVAEGEEVVGLKSCWADEYCCNETGKQERSRSTVLGRRGPNGGDDQRGRKKSIAKAPSTVGLRIRMHANDEEAAGMGWEGKGRRRERWSEGKGAEGVAGERGDWLSRPNRLKCFWPSRTLCLQICLDRMQVLYRTVGRWGKVGRKQKIGGGQRALVQRESWKTALRLLSYYPVIHSTKVFLWNWTHRLSTASLAR